MFFKKSLLKVLLYLLAIVGLLSIILLIIGYRPVNITTSPDWEAISSIGTILAIITALFITKWQDIINNKKKLKIQWFHVEKDQTSRVQYIGFRQDRKIDEFCVNFINIGNRKIVLDSVYIFLTNNLKKTYFPLNQENKEMNLPYALEHEMSICYYFPFMSLFKMFVKFVRDENVNENSYLILEVHDTTRACSH